MWDYVFAFGNPFNSHQQQGSNWGAALQNQMGSHFNQLQNPQSGAYQQLAMALQHPLLPPVERKADCEGCGAPLKPYIHHCEYCRRTA